jgi:hypothetical protein
MANYGPMSTKTAFAFGGDYGVLHPVIGIHFLNYAPFPSSEADDFQY